MTRRQLPSNCNYFPLVFTIIHFSLTLFSVDVHSIISTKFPFLNILTLRVPYFLPPSSSMNKILYPVRHFINH